METFIVYKVASVTVNPSTVSDFRTESKWITGRLRAAKPWHTAWR